MELTLILGPMKSGKSFDLINYFNSLKEKGILFSLFHSSRNVRDENIRSRNGIEIEAEKIDSLSEILENESGVIGIDEIHMFEEEGALVIKRLLERGTEIVISGLDSDYRGEVFPIIKKLLEIKPKEVRYKKATCEICEKSEAFYTQIYKDSEPILSGLASVVPDDGTYIYKPVCKNCFVEENK